MSSRGRIGRWRLIGAGAAGIFLIASVFSIVTLISVRSVTPYEETHPIVDYPEDYRTAEHIATTVAKAWDSDARLVRSGGVVHCTARDQLASGLRFEFGASKFFFGFPRVSFARVTIEPETNLVTIVAEPTDMFGQPAALDTKLIALDLEDALTVADKNGGAQFLREHPACSIGFSLYDYTWRLRYAADLRDYQNNNLRFEIDSRTGGLLSTSSE